MANVEGHTKKQESRRTVTQVTIAIHLDHHSAISFCANSSMETRAIHWTLLDQRIARSWRTVFLTVHLPTLMPWSSTDSIWIPEAGSHLKRIRSAEAPTWTLPVRPNKRAGFWVTSCRDSLSERYVAAKRATASLSGTTEPARKGVPGKLRRPSVDSSTWPPIGVL